jgi:hypothetical protein
VSSFDGFASTETLLAEQGMFAADERFARKHGGPVTNRVLDAVPDWYREEAASAGLQLNIDVRVHELRKDWFPAAPGWHCDAAVRETAFDDSAEKRVVDKNLVATVSSEEAGVSNTVFLSRSVTLDDVTYEESVANNSELLNQALAEVEQQDEVISSDGSIILFDPYTPHRVQAAQRDGTRLFVRISLWVPPTNHQPGLTRSEQVFFKLTDETHFGQKQF